MRIPSSAAMLVALLLAGCAKEAPKQDMMPANRSDATPANAAGQAKNEKAASATRPTDAWVGRWLGPEGLFLDIQPSKDGDAGHYSIINKDNLDREASYAGIAEGTTIRFVRDGKDMTIRPGTGAETGFKWLADKQDCLIVVAGQEGYCRQGN